MNVRDLIRPGGDHAAIEKGLNALLHCLDPRSVGPAESVEFQAHPNGFWTRREIGARDFLRTYASVCSRRDTLTLFLAGSRMSRLLGRQSRRKFPWLSTEPDSDLAILGIRLVNDNVVIWTSGRIFKVPLTASANNRLLMARRAGEHVSSLPASLAEYFLPIDFVDAGESIIQCSELCRPIDAVSWLAKHTDRLDAFLEGYFNKSLNDHTISSSSLARGLEHGDLHVNNMVLTRTGAIRFIDIEALKLDGYPLLDLVHFSIHTVSIACRRNSVSLYETLVDQPDDVWRLLGDKGFHRLSKLMSAHYVPEFGPLYLNGRLSWLRNNVSSRSRIERVESLVRKASQC